MVAIHFTDITGCARELDAATGKSLMEIAVSNGVEGLEGTCGGACSCATCHVKIAAAWSAIAGEPSEEELDMLSCVPDADSTSRLACQLMVDERLEGLVVRVAEKLA